MLATAEQYFIYTAVRTQYSIWWVDLYLKEEEKSQYY